MLKKIVLFSLLLPVSVLYGMMSDNNNEIEAKPSTPLSQLTWNLDHPMKCAIEQSEKEKFEFAQYYPKTNLLLVCKRIGQETYVEIRNPKDAIARVKINVGNDKNTVSLSPDGYAIAWLKDGHSQLALTNLLTNETRIVPHVDFFEAIFVEEVAFSSDKNTVQLLGHHENAINCLNVREINCNNFSSTSENVPYNLLHFRPTIFSLVHEKYYEHLMPSLSTPEWSQPLTQKSKIEETLLQLMASGVHALSPDKNILATLKNKTLYLFDINKEEIVHTHAFTEAYSSFELHNDSIVYMLKSEPGMLYIVNLFLPHNS